MGRGLMNLLGLTRNNGTEGYFKNKALIEHRSYERLKGQCLP